MKAILAEEWCTPDELVFKEIADPQPADNEVLIEVKAAGMNFPDILMIAGKYQARPKRPFAPGAEFAGVVIATGSEVSHVKAGDRVCAVSLTGGYAEKAVAPGAAVWVIPDSMSFVEAAGLMITYQSSYFGVVVRGSTQAGENLLIHAGAGGIGTAAIQIGKALGANVITTAGSEEKLELCRSLGADHALNYRDAKWAGTVRKELGGADVVIDPVGGPTFEQTLKCINFEGRIVIVGFTSGEIQQIPANLLLIKNVSAVGLHWNIYMYDHPDQIKLCVDQLFDWYEAGKIKPLISKTVSLQESPQALADIGARKSTGKVVIEI